MKLYLIRDGIKSGNVKIGLAKDAGRRVRQLQTGSTVRLYLQKTWDIPDESAHSVEAWLHRECRRYHVSGEWFSEPAAELAERLIRLYKQGDCHVL